MTATTDKGELLATRTTADGKMVGLWSDGVVTVGYLHTHVRGAGVAMTAEKRAENVRAGWLLLCEVAVYDTAELPAAVCAARKAASAADPIPAFRGAMSPVVKSARPHLRGCRCFRCVQDHARGGCRSLHCRTCGMTA